MYLFIDILIGVGALAIGLICATWTNSRHHLHVSKRDRYHKSQYQLNQDQSKKVLAAFLFPCFMGFVAIKTHHDGSKVKEQHTQHVSTTSKVIHKKKRKKKQTKRPVQDGSMDKAVSTNVNDSQRENDSVKVDTALAN